MTVKIKICGIKRPEDAQHAANAGVQAIGLNFAPESPRFLGIFDLAQQVIKSVPNKEIMWVGVFVNPSVEQVQRAAEKLGLQAVQLHGEESPELVKQIKQRVGEKIAVWKALHVAEKTDIIIAKRYTCDGIVIDSKVAGVRGGSGQTAAWHVLSELPRTSALILGGGLRPQNVAEAIRQVRPDWVDVASGVETAPGVKSAELIKSFVANAREAASAL